MIRDDDPENVAMIRQALRPVDALREQLERERTRARGAGEVQIDEPVGEQLLEELAAEQQALDAQLGVPAIEELAGELSPG